MNNAFKNFNGETVGFTKFFKPIVHNKKICNNTTIAVIKLKFGYEVLNVFSDVEIKKIEKERFVGVTRLHGNDIFDQQTGLDIAEHKAMAKAFNYINKLFINKAKTYKKYYESCCDLAALADARSKKQIKCYNKKGDIK